LNGYKFILGNIFWLSAVRIFTKVAALLTLPIITYYLSPQDFGVIAMVSVVQAFLSGIFSMGLVSYSSRIIYRYERSDRRECRECLGVVLFYILMFSTVGVVVSSLFIDRLVNFFIKDIIFPHRIYLYIPVLMAMLLAIYGFISDNILSLQINKKIFYLEIVQFILFMPLQIVGLCYWGFDVWDVIVLQAAVQVAITVYGLWLIREWLSFSWHKLSIFKEAMHYSLPMVPLNFLSWVQDRIDKVYLNNMISLNSVGIYTAGVNIATQYSFLSRPVMTAIKPEISKRLDAHDREIQSDIKDAFLIFVQFSLFLYLVISLFSKEVVQLLMNVRFHECYRIVPIFLLSIILSEATGIFQLKFVFRNQTIWFPVTLFFSALLNVYFNYTLIPIFFVYGAALAKTLSEVILFFITLYISQRLHRTDYGLIRNLWPLLAVLALVYSLDAVALSTAYLFLLKLSVVLLYAWTLDYLLSRISRRYRETRNIVTAGIRERMARWKT